MEFDIANNACVAPSLVFSVPALATATLNENPAHQAKVRHDPISQRECGTTTEPPIRVDAAVQVSGLHRPGHAVSHSATQARGSSTTGEPAQQQQRRVQYNRPQ
jgi:hypothetical protein